MSRESCQGSGLTEGAESAAIGNLYEPTAVFVAREEHLRRIRALLQAPDAPRPVVVIHGVPGVGKTELALQYAESNRGRYPGGTWLVRASGHSRMLRALSQLLDDDTFRSGVDTDVGGPETDSFWPSWRSYSYREVLRQLREVPDQLRRRGEDLGPVLVIIDDAVDSAILGEAQLGQLPSDENIHYIVTTPLDPTAIPSGNGRAKSIGLDVLSRDEARQLIGSHQALANSAANVPGGCDGQTVERIVDLIDLTPVVVEQVATLLAVGGARPAAGELLAKLEAHGSELHQEAVLQATLTGLDQSGLDLLCLAGAFPGGIAPWSWVTDAVAQLPADSGTSTGEYLDRSAQLLRQRRLLTSGNDPNQARVHPLVAAAADGPSRQRLVAELADWLQEDRRSTRVCREAWASPWHLSALCAMLGASGSLTRDGLLLLLPGTGKRMEPDSRFLFSVPNYVGFPGLRWATLAMHTVYERRPRRKAPLDFFMRSWMYRLLMPVDVELAFKQLSIGVECAAKQAEQMTRDVSAQGNLCDALVIAAEATAALDSEQAVALSRLALTRADQLAAAIPWSVGPLADVIRLPRLLSLLTLLRSLELTDPPAGLREVGAALSATTAPQSADPPSTDPGTRDRLVEGRALLDRALARCRRAPRNGQADPAEFTASLALAAGIEVNDVPNLRSNYWVRVAAARANLPRQPKPHPRLMLVLGVILLLALLISLLATLVDAHGQARSGGDQPSEKVQRYADVSVSNRPLGEACRIRVGGADRCGDYEEGGRVGADADR